MSHESPTSRKKPARKQPLTTRRVYTPATMTKPQRRALEAVAMIAGEKRGTAQVARGYAYPTEVARRLWPDSPGWNHRSSRGSTAAGGALGATMPMKAATLLWRLHRMDLVSVQDHTCWSLTDKGVRVLFGETS